MPCKASAETTPPSYQVIDSGCFYLGGHFPVQARIVGVEQGMAKDRVGFGFEGKAVF